MRSWLTGLIVPVILVACPVETTAASLQVSPVSIEIAPPGAAATITLRNLGNEPLNAQIRVFQWTQAKGADELSATRKVVASPPAARLAPGRDYVVRIVRTDKTPIQGEEAYRLIVDEIPKPRMVNSSAVNFAVRYSVPVFFTQKESQAALAWGARLVSGRLEVNARNQGERRVRISALKVVNQSGATLNFGSGLIGYVLGNSSARWTAKAAPAGIKPGGSITIIAQSDYGPIKAPVRVGTAK